MFSISNTYDRSSKHDLSVEKIGAYVRRDVTMSS